MRVESVVQRGIDAPQAPGAGVHRAPQRAGPCEHSLIPSAEDFGVALEGCGTRPADPRARDQDRKSTRLNSSHGYISYAVFCLKKKKTNVFKLTETCLICMTQSKETSR